MGGGGFQVEVRQGIKSSHWAYGGTGRGRDVACFEIEFKY